MRILITNADDMGYTRGVNQAIAQCFAAGMLRSSTLMANGAAFDDAIALARNSEDLDVGVHLVLTELPPVSSQGKICGLVDEGGYLPGTVGELMLSLLAGRINKEALRQELSSQITKVLDHGVQPSHLDTHKHVHVVPQILEVVVELARKFSIPWVRNPFDETPFFRLARLVDSKNTAFFCIQQLKARLARVTRASFWGRIRGSSVRAPDHFFGTSLTGIWNEAAMIEFLKELPPGMTEWMIHPGNCDEELRRMDTRLLEQRENEKNLLISQELREQLTKRNIILSSFRAEVR
jgi:predicted glycoside hydrolase/deacetylase ChbG (UPF0249 family)